MKKYVLILSFLQFFFLILLTSCKEKIITSAEVPMMLDHDRILVDVEIQRTDGSWRSAKLWIDSGNPDFIISGELASDLGYELPESRENTNVPPPSGVRIGGMALDFDSVNTTVMFEPFWLFSAMGNDGNLPSTLMKKYHVVFDYREQRFTIAQPGTVHPHGTRAPASIHPETGIVQIDAVIDGDSMSFALDNGASYSFVSSTVMESLLKKHPDLPQVTGTAGCANMWGYFPPGEETFRVYRLPAIIWGGVRLTDVGIVGVSPVPEFNIDIGKWYSFKTSRPVAGFLGANALKSFRVEIDYADSAVYFERGASFDPHDMDIVGLTLRPLSEGTFSIIGIVEKDGKPVVEGVEPGDILLKVDDLETSGATMGTVTDALRGDPGEIRILEIERDGERFKVEAEVKRLL